MVRKFKKMDERKLVLDDTKARDWEIKIICALYVTIKKGAIDSHTPFRSHPPAQTNPFFDKGSGYLPEVAHPVSLSGRCGANPASFREGRKSAFCK